MVSRYMFIGLLVSWIAGAQGAESQIFIKLPEETIVNGSGERIVKRSWDTFNLSLATSVKTLNPQKELFVASYSAAFKKNSDMEKMNKKCGIPTTNEDLEKDFKAAFTVDSVNAGDLILVNAYRVNNALAGFLFMSRVLDQNSKPVPGDFKLGFVAIEPDLFGSGLGSELIRFILTNTEGLQRVVSPARPTNDKFTECLKNIFFEEDKEEAETMVKAILNSDAPQYQKELAEQDMTAYVYDAQKVRTQDLKKHDGPVLASVLGAVFQCTIS